MALVFLMSTVLPAVAHDTKIAFVNVALVIANSDIGKKTAEEMKKLVEKELENLQKQEKEIFQMRADLDKQRGVIRSEVFQERENDIQRRLRDLQVKKSNAEDDIRFKQQEKMQVIGKMLAEVFQEIGKKEKYTLILDTYSLQPPYFDQSKDITERIIAELNKKR